jgi:hypothetical protein
MTLLPEARPVALRCWRKHFVYGCPLGYSGKSPFLSRARIVGPAC